MSVMTLQARKVLAVQPEQLMECINGEFNLAFDNGEIIFTNDKETFISSFFWDAHRKYDSLPLRKEHHLTTHLKGRRLRGDSHKGIMAAVYDDWYSIYRDIYTTDEKLDFLNTLYTSFNNYYNRLSTHASEYMMTIDIRDVVELYANEDIKRIRREGDYSHMGIKKIHEDTLNVIANSPNLQNNNISKYLRSGLIKPGQLVQCIGPIGYARDVDDTVFRYPIKRGYMEGMRTMYEYLTESRTVSMALFFALLHVRRTEYNSRKGQLLGINLETLHRGDCGSKNYIPWEVNTNKDVDSMEGIYYFDESTKTEKCVAKGDYHLVGKIIPIRLCFCCNHPDPSGVCLKCFGEIGRNIIEGTIIGQQAGVTIFSELTQMTLSAKHLIMTAIINALKLTVEQTPFLSLTDDKMGYILNPSLEKEGLKMVIDKHDMRSLSYVLNMTDIENISAPRTSSIKTVKLMYMVRDKEGEKEYREILLPVEFQGRSAFATREFLAYIRSHPPETDERDNYVIDLSEWNFSKVIMKCPPKQFSMIGFTKDVSAVLEARRSDAQYRDSMSPVEFVKDFYELISQRTNVNLSVVAAVAYSAMIVSAQDNDYSLPKPWTDKGVGILKDTITRRSLSGALAYERQADTLTDPISFLCTNRPDGMYDPLFLPQMVRTIMDREHYKM